MMPFSKIQIGDIFEGMIKGSEYTVINKTDGLIELLPSYQHPALPNTIWKRPSDRIFRRRIYNTALELTADYRAVT